jgi:TonB family protein
MRIDFKRRPALWASISLHGILLLLAALFTLISFPETPDSTHVFEMLASDGLESDSSSPTPASTAKLPEPYAPKLKPLPELAPAKPVPAPPKPAVKSPPVAVKEMSYEEFKRQHAIQSPKLKPKQANPSSAKLPQLNTANIRKNLQHSLQNPSSHAPRATSNEASAIDAYGAQVNQLLNRAWKKPAQLTGVRLSVTVVFAVSAAGQIMQPRLSPSSGNPAFDRSVLEAFKQVGFVGISPNGQKNVFQMTFRMVD